MDLHLSIKEIFTAFMVLFAVIDITGSTPIIINLNATGKQVQAGKAALISYAVMITFLFAGDALLQLFNVDISSFAIAGALVLLVLAVEMIFSVEIFRNDGPAGSVTIVPLTTTLSLRAECHLSNLILAISLNMLLVYLVLRNAYLVERILGKSGVYVLRKFFGIILLAMSVRLFISNLSMLLNSFSR